MSKRSRVFNEPIKSAASVTLFGDVEPTPSPDASAPPTLKLNQIQINDQQPRRYFDPDKLEQLKTSIQEHGVLEPLIVRPLGKGYQLVAGERRYRAARELGLKEVPVVVHRLSDEQAIQVALIENLQREDLNPVEETVGILQLLSLRLDMAVEDVPRLLYRLQNEARAATHNVIGNDDEAEFDPTHNVIGKELEVVESLFSALATMNWESFVNNRLPLLNLPAEVLTALEQGKIAYTKAQAIARVKDEEQRAALLEEAISEGLSLSEIRQQIEQFKAAEQSEQGDEPVEPAQQLKHEFKQLSQAAGRSKAWSNPKKQKKLRKLLDELKALIEE